jgi:hypothetical protein
MTRFDVACQHLHHDVKAPAWRRSLAFESSPLLSFLCIQYVLILYMVYLYYVIRLNLCATSRNCSLSVPLMADMVALPPSREVLGTGDPSMQCDVYSSGTASFLLTIPAEVLERIAFYVCTLQPTGPPAIRPLLSACRAINQTLTPDRNAALYADVFRAKFDAAAIRRRLGPWEPSSSALRDELVRRFLALKRIRTGAARFKYHVDDTPSPFAADPEDEGDLWTLLLIMLEDDGLNARQAKEYANADAWLETYWLRTPREVLIHPSRFGQAAMQPWIPDSGRNALAMWCFWILLRPGASSSDQTL